MKTNGILLIVLFTLLVSCKGNEKDNSSLNGNDSLVNSKKNEVFQAAKRMGMVTGIKPDRIEEYKKLHAKVWPTALKKIKECNIQNYSIYLQKIDDKYFLFSYFEYVGTDFDMDMKKMAADSTTQSWWKVTAPTQIPLPEAASKKETWANMEEVFHTN